MVRRRPGLFLAITGLLELGCQPKPHVMGIQERTRRLARVETPTAVRAGPYRLDFVPSKGRAWTMVWSEEGGHAMLDLQAPFTLRRPSGRNAALRIRWDDPRFGVGVGRGAYYNFPSGPKPNWNDLLTLSKAVPIGWRGGRIGLKGEFQELAMAHYVATFATARFEDDGEPEGMGAIARPLKVSLKREETAILQDGVTATVTPVDGDPRFVRVKVAWKPRRILPDVRDDDMLSPTVISKAGRILSYGVGTADRSEATFTFAFGYDPATGGVPSAIRLAIDLTKRVRGYPIQVPLRLVWPKEP